MQTKPKRILKDRQKLLRILYFKNSLISQQLELIPKQDLNPRLRYLLKEDIEEVKQWPDDEVTKIISTMKQTIHNLCRLNDGLICPWCVCQDYCHLCNYGKRHGVCLGEEEETDTYESLLDTLSIKSLCDIPGMIDGIMSILNKD